MRIGIDARLWGEAGVGRYIRNLVQEISKIDLENQYYLLLLKKNLSQNLPPNFTELEADFRWYSLTEQRKLPKILNKLDLDIVHFPHFNVPLFYKRKFVVTIHDLIHKHHKMNRSTTLNPLVYRIKHYAYNQAFKVSLKKSQKVITVSEFVKRQIIEEMEIPKEKIEVTYEAVDEKIIKLNKKLDKKRIQNILNKFGIKPPFIFYVGNAHPHKNVEGLIEAFLKLRKNYQYLQLVLSGHDHYFWERLKKEFIDSRVGRNDDVKFTGFVTDEELVALYKSCKTYVFPSFEEGFGIPLLEAMACGVPVVSSNAGSLPEIGGDAALYFNPKSVDDMAEKIKEVLNNQVLRKKLVEKGKARVKDFSWKKLAEKTLSLYESVADN